MRRVDNIDLYQLGNTLRPLRSMQNPKLLDVFIDVHVARDQLQAFLAGRPELVYCRRAILDLVAALDRLIALGDNPPKAPGPENDAYWNSEVPWGIAYGVTSGTQALDTLLAAELRLLDSYLVSPKGIYSTPLLVEHAEQQFPVELSLYLSDKAKDDFRQAGRCLAFELPTACGFHALRSVEAVMRSYYEQLTGRPLEERLPTWDAYIKKLRGANADERVTLLLDQVREKHRNPVMHPEETLTLNQAMTLFGLSQSAIIAMLERIAGGKAAAGA